MKELYKEQLSQLLDDELEGNKLNGLLEELEKDLNLHLKLDRYALIGEALSQSLECSELLFVKAGEEAIAPAAKQRMA
ncbi:MAG: RseA family anti-sigma factor [Cycloclasticus sp.]